MDGWTVRCGRWRGGAVVARWWRGGAVAQWRGGAVAQWRGGAVARGPRVCTGAHGGWDGEEINGVDEGGGSCVGGGTVPRAPPASAEAKTTTWRSSFFLMRSAESSTPRTAPPMAPATRADCGGMIR